MINSKPGRSTNSRPQFIASWVLMNMRVAPPEHTVTNKSGFYNIESTCNSSHSMSLELYHTTHNAGPTTVVLIHGALVSGLYWDLVIPHLPTSYHLLVPDLPGHGKSQSTQFSIDVASRMIAQLIRTHAINGSAHIIGHSLAWTMCRVENCLARPLISWAMDGADIPRIDTNVCTIDLCRQIVAPENPTEWPAPWPARTLIVAAGKGGLIPTKDSLHDAVKLMEIGRELNEETVACTHLSMRHPWNRQAPRLFAETARAWFESKELPEGFVKL
ncbi:unnamed protein product [Penicillium nalgiovense]|nr:unnamed protein product [Penicillium nalgiovense]